MMTRIITPRVTAVALAASALFAAPAAADRVKPRASASVTVDLGESAQLTLSSARGHVHHAHHRRGDRYYYDDRDLRRDAVRQCRQAIRSEGYSRGFRDVDFEGRRVRQVGPRGFVVRFNTEFEGRRREFERNVRCEVRRGRIVALDGVPWPGRRYRGGRDYDRIHQGHDHARGAYCPLDGGRDRRGRYY